MTIGNHEAGLASRGAPGASAGPPATDYTSLPFGELQDEEVLFFIRIRGKRSYFRAYYPPSLLQRFTGLKAFRTISEYKRDADVHIDLNAFAYSALNDIDRELLRALLPIAEIATRCRALRRIGYVRAKECIIRCGAFFLDLYRRLKLKLIVCGTVDNYVMDIMVRLGRAHGVTFLGVTDFFLEPYYKLSTVYGERNVYDTAPAADEVNRVLQLLEGKRKSPLVIAKSRAYRQAAWNIGSYCYRVAVRFGFKHICLGRLEYEYQFAYIFGGLTPLRSLFWPGRYFDRFNPPTLRQGWQDCVYIPLHHYPEATIDYWVDDPDKADYEHGLLDVIGFFRDSGVRVILKEHPGFYLCRPASFYRRMKACPNVLLLDPFVSTQEVLDVVENVVVWNGSTGVEAVMLGKKVTTVTRSYYSEGLLFNYREFRSAAPLTPIQRADLVRNILRSSIRV